MKQNPIFNFHSNARDHDFSYLSSSARLTTQPPNYPPNSHHPRTAESWSICHLLWMKTESGQKAGCDLVFYLMTTSHKWMVVHGQYVFWCFLRVLIYWPEVVMNRGSTQELRENWSRVKSWMEFTIKRTDLVLEEAKWIAGQKAGGQVGEKSYIIFFNKAEGMANTKWPHTETSKRQYIDKKNHSIMLFFQRQNKTKVAFSGFSLKLLPPVKTYSSLFSCQLSKPHHC